MVQDTIINLIDLALGFEEKGGPGSGHRGHKGIKGQRGGSAPGKGAHSIVTPDGLNSTNTVQGMIARGVGGRDDEDLLEDKTQEIISEMKDTYGEYTGDYELIDYTFVEDALFDWEVDSHHGEAKSLHVAAEREFGSKVSDYTKNVIGGDYSGWDTEPEQNLLRTVYDRTQGELRGYGVGSSDDVVLYRGEVRTSKPESGKVSRNALEAWTTSKQKAQFYVERNKDLPGKGYVLTTNIPSSQIASLPHTGMGVGSVNEVVVLGGKGMNIEVEESM